MHNNFLGSRLSQWNRDTKTWKNTLFQTQARCCSSVRRPCPCGRVSLLSRVKYLEHDILFEISNINSRDSGSEIQSRAVGTRGQRFHGLERWCSGVRSLLLIKSFVFVKSSFFFKVANILLSVPVTCVHRPPFSFAVQHFIDLDRALGQFIQEIGLGYIMISVRDIISSCNTLITSIAIFIKCHLLFFFSPFPFLRTKYFTLYQRALNKMCMTWSILQNQDVLYQEFLCLFGSHRRVLKKKKKKKSEILLLNLLLIM